MRSMAMASLAVALLRSGAGAERLRYQEQIDLRAAYVKHEADLERTKVHRAGVDCKAETIVLEFNGKQARLSAPDANQGASWSVECGAGLTGKCWFQCTELGAPKPRWKKTKCSCQFAEGLEEPTETVKKPVVGGCGGTQYGCCPGEDENTGLAVSGPNGEGCPSTKNFEKLTLPVDKPEDPVVDNKIGEIDFGGKVLVPELVHPEELVDDSDKLCKSGMTGRTPARRGPGRVDFHLPGGDQGDVVTEQCGGFLHGSCTFECKNLPHDGGTWVPDGKNCKCTVKPDQDQDQYQDGDQDYTDQDQDQHQGVCAGIDFTFMFPTQDGRDSGMVSFSLVQDDAGNRQHPTCPGGSCTFECGADERGFEFTAWKTIDCQCKFDAQWERA